MKNSSFLTKIIKKNKGFLLVDSIVAIVIIGVALVALVQLYTQGTKATVIADAYESAVQVGNERMEFLKKGTDMDITAAGGLNDLISKANSSPIVTANNIEYTTNCSTEQAFPVGTTTAGRDKIRKIKVDITWPGANGAGGTLTMTSYVSVK